MTAAADICSQSSLRPFLQVHPSWGHAPIAPQTPSEGLTGEHKAPLYEPSCEPLPANSDQTGCRPEQAVVPGIKTPCSKPARKRTPDDSVKDSIRSVWPVSGQYVLGGCWKESLCQKISLTTGCACCRRDMHWLLAQQSISAFDAGLEPVYCSSSKLLKASWHAPQQLTSLAGFSARGADLPSGTSSQGD